MKTQGEIESAVSEGICRFEQECMGQGPKNIRAYLLKDLLVVRLHGAPNAAEQQLLQTSEKARGRDLLKQLRKELVGTRHDSYFPVPVSLPQVGAEFPPLKQRLGPSYQDVRAIRKMLELTGRLPGDEVPRAITALEVPTDSQQGNVVDVCLASDIIEVGVDKVGLGFQVADHAISRTTDSVCVHATRRRTWKEDAEIVNRMIQTVASSRRVVRFARGGNSELLVGMFAVVTGPYSKE